MPEMSNIVKEIEKGNVAAVKRLLSINPNCVLVVNAGEDRTPLHVAAHLGNPEIVRVLLSHEAKFEAQDKHGNTALHLACESGSLETMQALLGAGKKVTLRTKNRDGQTPLHIAVNLGEVDMVKGLMSAGARPDVKDKEGLTPFDLIPEGRDDITDTLSMDYGLVYQRASPQQTTSRRLGGSRPSSRGSSGHAEKSPERVLQQTQSTPARRRTENPQQVPRKQIAIQEQAIQGLKSDLQELEGRLDTVQEYLEEKKEAIDCGEKVHVQVENHDRQLAELDQRLAFQESHLRDLRPQVGHLGDESRLNREQYQHMKQMVDMWRESVRSSLERVLDRVKEWENASAKLTAEKSPSNDAEFKEENFAKHEEIEKLEKQLSAAQQVIAELQATASSAKDDHTEVEKGLKMVMTRLHHVESLAQEKSEESQNSTAELSSMSQQHVDDMNHKMEKLQTQLSKAASRSERVEEMFDEQLRMERARKAEQERELSQREAKILEFRHAALEEEQQRRELFVAHEDQRRRMTAMEERVDSLLAKVEKGSDAVGLAQKIGELETQVEGLEARLHQSEQSAQPGKCCIIV